MVSADCSLLMPYQSHMTQQSQTSTPYLINQRSRLFASMQMCHFNQRPTPSRQSLRPTATQSLHTRTSDTTHNLRVLVVIFKLFTRCVDGRLEENHSTKQTPSQTRHQHRQRSPSPQTHAAPRIYVMPHLSSSTPSMFMVAVAQRQWLQRQMSQMAMMSWSHLHFYFALAVKF